MTQVEANVGSVQWVVSGYILSTELRARKCVGREEALGYTAGPESG